MVFWYAETVVKRSPLKQKEVISMTKKILIVESNKIMHDLWKEQLPEFSLLRALNQAEAEKVFQENKESIDFIIMGSCKMTMGDITTEHVTKKLRGTYKFTGRIIPMSVNPDFRNRLIESGCDSYPTITGKEHLPETVKRFFR